MDLHTPEWVAIFVFGAGALVSTLGKRMIRAAGFAVMAVAIIGYFLGHHGSAEGQAPITNNAPSINTLNQSGGNNTINVAPQRLGFDPRLADYVIGKIPAGKPVAISAVGSLSDTQVADQYQSYFEQHGVHIAHRSNIGTLSPPPDKKIMIVDQGDMVAITIAPSVP